MNELMEETRIVPPSYLMNEKQLAEYLGISESTLRRWRLDQIAKHDPLPVLYISGCIWFSRVAIEEFIQDHLEPDTLKRKRSF